MPTAWLLTSAPLGVPLALGLTWGVSGAAVLAVACQAYRRARRRKRRRSSEEGAAYALSLVLTLPLYVTLVAVFAQTTVLLISQLGLNYAALAAARAAMVWEASDLPQSQLDAHIRTAAWNAATPFVSGDPAWLPSSADVGSSQAEAAQQYAAAFAAYPWRPGIAADQLAAKRRHAAMYLEVQVARIDAAAVAASAEQGVALEEGDVVVSLHYAMPLPIPAAGWILGTAVDGPQGPARVYRLGARAVLPVEYARGDRPPRGAAGPTLGIRYDSIH